MPDLQSLAQRWGSSAQTPFNEEKIICFRQYHNRNLYYSNVSAEIINKADLKVKILFSDCHLALVEFLHPFHIGLQSLSLPLELSDSLLQLHKQANVHGSLLHSHLL